MPDIYKNIQDGKYKNKVEIGGTSYKPKELRDVEKKPAGELTDTEFAKLKVLREQFDKEHQQYRADAAAYRAEEARLNDIIEQDCAEAEGVENNPKRGMLWGKAWEQGHAVGLGDVYSCYSDLAELIK